MWLYMDTETSDYSERDNPALPVQIAMLVATEERVVCTCAALLSQRDWVGIRHNVIRVEKPGIQAHGITDEMCDRFGVHPQLVLNWMSRWIPQCVGVVAHNVEFDVTVMNHAYTGLGLPVPVWPEQICTMRESARILRIPSGGKYAIDGWKAPKLTEAYRYFARRDMTNNHDALHDVYACRLVHRGIMQHRAALVAADAATE